MKTVLHRSFYVFLVLVNGAANCQALIHSHNDYVRQKPFYEALQAKVYSLEADVFLRDSLLCVSHTEIEINRSKTLDNLYLEPLTRYCADVKARHYLPLLMIDIKNDGQKTLALLVSKLAGMKQRLKSEGINIMPVFVISGDRPPVDSFKNYPAYIQFDGRPSEVYNDSALAKVGFISDQYLKYGTWTGKGTMPISDSATISRLAHSVHEKGKKLRLWNTPDSPAAWATFKKIGVDIINTDQPLNCRKFFEERGL